MPLSVAILYPFGYLLFVRNKFLVITSKQWQPELLHGGSVRNRFKRVTYFLVYVIDIHHLIGFRRDVTETCLCKHACIAGRFM